MRRGGATPHLRALLHDEGHQEEDGDSACPPHARSCGSTPASSRASRGRGRGPPSASTCRRSSASGGVRFGRAHAAGAEGRRTFARRGRRSGRAWGHRSRARLRWVPHPGGFGRLSRGSRSSSRSARASGSCCSTSRCRGSPGTRCSPKCSPSSRRARVAMFTGTADPEQPVPERSSASPWANELLWRVRELLDRSVALGYGYSSSWPRARSRLATSTARRRTSSSCSPAFLPLRAEDTLVFLGDYVDRGPQSAQVVDYVQKPFPVDSSEGRRASRQPRGRVAARHRSRLERFRGAPSNGCLAALGSYTGGEVPAEDALPATTTSSSSRATSSFRPTSSSGFVRCRSGTKTNTPSTCMRACRAINKGSCIEQGARAARVALAARRALLQKLPRQARRLRSYADRVPAAQLSGYAGRSDGPVGGRERRRDRHQLRQRRLLDRARASFRHSTCTNRDGARLVAGLLETGRRLDLMRIESNSRAADEGESHAFARENGASHDAAWLACAVQLRPAGGAERAPPLRAGRPPTNSSAARSLPPPGRCPFVREGRAPRPNGDL